MFTGQTEKYLDTSRKVIFTNSTDWTRDGWEVIEYDDSLTFPEKFCHCLSSVDTKTCMLNLEDFPLYDQPNVEKLNQLVNEVGSSSIDCVKLLRGVDMPIFPLWIEGLYKIPESSPYLFAYQPSIWKTNRLIEFFDRCKEDCKNNTAHQFESVAQKFAREMGLFAAFTYEGEPQRGAHHFDSFVYPAVCAAVLSGKWNTTEYRKELDMMFSEYNIDPSIRGEV